jgi:hypothetical protein
VDLESGKQKVLVKCVDGQAGQEVSSESCCRVLAFDVAFVVADALPLNFEHGPRRLVCSNEKPTQSMIQCIREPNSFPWFLLCLFLFVCSSL